MIALMLAIPSATGFDVTEVIVRPATPKLRLVGGTDMAKSELEVQIAQIEARRAAVEPGQTEFTVVQFCKQRGLELSMRDMQRMGKAAAKFSREAGLQISRAADEWFFEVNSYCIQALEAVAGVFGGGGHGGSITAPQRGSDACHDIVDLTNMKHNLELSQ